MNSIYGNSILLSTKALDYLWEKESVISNNLANVETPGYKAKYITFEDELKSRLDALASDGEEVQSDKVAHAIQNSTYQIHESKDESSRLDGNNVNADVELMEMTRTALQYQYILNSVSSDVTRLNTVIKGQ